MTVDSVFWIASMTKAVTTTAAMQMVEQGKLKLDQPASEILPELASPQVLEGFDAAGAPKLRPAKRPITLRQLLTHTAGYTYDIWNENTGRYEKYANLPGIITCKNEALKTPLAFRPGRSLGIRHQHRFCRQDGRKGKRRAARKLFPRAHLRASRHGRYKLQAQPVATRATCGDARAWRRRLIETDRI